MITPRDLIKYVAIHIEHREQNNGAYKLATTY